jgi:alpha-amylase/alpha-mannosidase (GH57 family)
VTLNVTPVLMEQLEDYSRPAWKDRILDVIRKPAGALDADERAILLDHVFKLHAPTMIAPFPRYRELKNVLDGTGAKKVREEEIRDLQTLYLLTWLGRHLRQAPGIRELYEKRKDYTEEEKTLVFEACQSAVREVLPLYRQVGEKTRSEISTTPYYHPILPLVIDCDSAREAKPGVELDEVSFRHPQDARWHVEEAVRAFEGHFGRPPRGMWPAEGSVSEAALNLLASAGMKWAATDDGVLSRSLGHAPLSEEDRHGPYAFGDRELLIYFRDHELSDRIGFVYSSWEPERAADDLIGRLLGIRERLGRKEASACVTIILDGENPWEHYRDSGVEFLSRLYRLLAGTPGLETTALGDPAMTDDRKRRRLSRVVAGSWIDANFDTWIGGPEKNRAWNCLGQARQKLAAEASGATVPREFYRAEGSDWFWWLGPGHDTPYEASYENLFRTNLLEGLAKVGIEPPAILKVATRMVQSTRFRPPLHLFTPPVSGRRGNYYAWVAAGSYQSSEGSIHRATRLLESVRFGFDAEKFYLRGEGDLAVVRDGKEPLTFAIEFGKPAGIRAVFAGGRLLLAPFAGGEGQAGTTNGGRPPAGVAGGGPAPSRGEAAMGQVVEAGIPRRELGVEPGELLAFALIVEQGAEAMDRLPQSGYITVTVPPADFGVENWSV